LFNLPSDVPLILFGAVSPVSNERKGFDLLYEAISEFAENSDTDAELVVFGSEESDSAPEFDLPIHYTGYLNDEESLALLYSAADVMVVPSRYEGFGQTVTESMASGTPVVAFDTTGPKDTVVHKETGYLASPYDPSDLATGIEFLLNDDERRSRIGQSARSRAVEKYHYTDVAEKYYDLYESIVG
jgi:glycosyltransferase involved in cell wall biosynthesis